MKKKLLNLGIVLSLFCFIFLTGKYSACAAEPNENETEILFVDDSLASTEQEIDLAIPTTESTITEDANDIDNSGEDNYLMEEIKIQGIEDKTIVEIKDIVLSKARSSCGGNHTWETVNVVQEGNCELEWIYKIRCTVCGTTATAYTDAPGHNYVDGVCTVCGGIEVAPDEELAKWEYTLNETEGTITLTKYISDVPDIIVYGAYKVNEIVYSAVLNGRSDFYFRQLPFYEKRENITSIVLKKGVSSTYCENLFASCKSLKLLDIRNFNTSNVTNMSFMFFGCKTLKELDVANLNTSNVTDMNQMFGYCYNLTSIKNLSNLNTSNAITMMQMFENCYQLTDIDVSNFNTANVNNMSFMFSCCYLLKDLDISKFDTSNVINFAYMFQSCRSLKTIDLSNFNTSNATRIDGMFNLCNNLTNIDVSRFETSNVTYTERMFQGCNSLQNINVSNFNTSKVTDMNSMFSDCYQIQSLDLRNFDTSNVTNMGDMFRNCKNLSNLNIKKFNTSKVTAKSIYTDGRDGMSMMFKGCSNLTSLNLTSFETSKATFMNEMFKDCTKLTNIYVDEDNWVTTGIDITDMFTGCGTQSVTKI